MGQTDLEAHIKNQLTQLKEARQKGTKVIGFFPGNYVPEEIIYASGAIPICLAHGSLDAAEAALTEVPDKICPFARAQIGEKLLKTNPYYNMIDMLIAPVSCLHMLEAADIWIHHADVEIFKLGIPHQSTTDFGLQYYMDRLRVLKELLQAYTGNEITDKRLSEAIDIYNKIRRLLKKISLLRRSSSPPFSAMDFIKLNHASFYADPVVYGDILDSLYEELKTKEQAGNNEAPRLLLIGPNVAYGDYKVLELVQSAGGEIVIEELCEGIRYYWNEIDNKADILESLAVGYLQNRVPCAFIRDSAKARFDFVLELIKDFNISGVIWYQLLCCEVYDAESYYFSKMLEKHNLPMLILESDYSMSDLGRLKIRIEAFIEQLRGVMSNA
jgi:benzoyl-CoA reductase/2-hydroxyglutaryl-CoA dehydratase subunit BcrC/BadD/HgdB